MTLKEIARLLQGDLNGPEDLEITGPAKIEEAGSNQITFLSNKRYTKYLSETRAGAVIVDRETQDIPIPHIRVDNPYMGFLFVLRMFDPGLQRDFSGISGKALISSGASVGADCHIAAGAYIAEGAQLGSGCVLFPGVVIGKNARIGDSCVLYPNVSVRENCVLGRRVVIHDGTVVGSDGFGFAPYQGQYHKIPQLGNVVIEDDVEIGANCALDRATTGSTLIKRGAKIDNLVQIAHNCVVGEHTVIAAQTGMAGTTQVGNWVTIAGQVGLAGHLKVGDKATIAAQSGITKDVPPGETMFGYPALPIQQTRRIEVTLRKLPEKIKELNALNKEITKIKEALKKQGMEFDESETGND